MRWITITAASAFLILLLINQVSSTAKFELELTDYINAKEHDENGHCCSGYRRSDGVCSEKCRTKFRVCLNVYQVVIDYKSPCVFGEVETPVLGGNEIIDFSTVNPVHFNFATWQISFSLIIEAWHDNNGTSTGPVLLQRLMTHGDLNVDPHWSFGSQENEHSSLSYRFRVVCKEHYYGKNCRKWCRPRDDELGHYTCDRDGNIQCLPGWEKRGSDEYCITPICSQGCKDKQGICVSPNECRCLPGWEGDTCDTCKKYPGCKYGTCNKTWECNCDEGWGGHFCDQDLNYCTNHKPCKNGATCHNTNPGAYTCMCPPGFRGTNCEIRNHTCATDPCNNGGTCLDTGNGRFVCQCPTGFSGSYCHISGKSCSDRPCLNGGTCISTGVGFKCHCRNGFEGETCQTESNECESSPCLNGGSCVDEESGFRCVCPVGFSGRRCAENIDNCRKNPCVNQGKCIDGVNSFRCQCQPGFTGIFCETRVNSCHASLCANGGTCFNTSNDFKCHCKPEWSGRHCTEKYISPCKKNPCKNGGACSDAPELSSGYRCQCPSGLIGPQCTVKTSSMALLDSEEPKISMSQGQIVLIVLLSTALPIIALVFIVYLVCVHKKRRRDNVKEDDLARQQNERNIIHNAVSKGLESHMIINSLDYPVKPINTDTQYNQLPTVHYPPSSKQQQQQQQQHNYSNKKAVENAYEVVKTRSTKTINTDSSRLSLASRLEKELDASCGRRNDDMSSYCKTPDPSSNYSHHTINSCGSREDSGMHGGGGGGSNIIHPSDLIHNNSNNTAGTPSTCTTPSSIYVIDLDNNCYDDTYIATQV